MAIRIQLASNFQVVELTYDNEKVIIQGCYTISNVVKASDKQICFIVRSDSNDFLITLIL